MSDDDALRQAADMLRAITMHATADAIERMRTQRAAATAALREIAAHDPRTCRAHMASAECAAEIVLVAAETLARLDAGAGE